MTVFRQLLAATDFSEPATQAVERAALIARELGASLELIHVANLGLLTHFQQLVADVPADLEKRLLNALQDELGEQADRLQGKYAISVHTRVAAGPLVPELCGQVDDLTADLVVLGAQGSSLMRRLLMGSTATRMVKQCTHPVLVVKQPARQPYRDVLIPTDFSTPSQRTLEHALALAPQAALQLLHAFEVPFEGRLRLAGIEDDTLYDYRVAARQKAQQDMLDLCQAVGLPPHGARMTVVHGKPLQQILDHANHCDLIVMGKHGASLVEEFLLGSITRQVLAEAPCDVLVSV